MLSDEAFGLVVATGLYIFLHFYLILSLCRHVHMNASAYRGEARITDVWEMSNVGVDIELERICVLSH